MAPLNIEEVYRVFRIKEEKSPFRTWVKRQEKRKKKSDLKEKESGGKRKKEGGIDLYA